MLKKVGLLVILVGLVLAPTTALAKGARPGAEKYSFYQACDLLGGAYCGEQEEPDATGKLIVNQPNGDVSIVLTAIFDGLEPNAEYIVYLAGTEYTTTWPGGKVVGTIVADDYGHADFHMNVEAADLATDDYTWSIWLNNAGNQTVLVSDNFNFVIE